LKKKKEEREREEDYDDTYALVIEEK